MKLKTVNWGIIGCGDVTEIKSGPPLYNIKNSKIAAVMRRTSKKAADYARRHKVEKWYAQADKLIEDPEVNAVYVATPPDSHKEYTLKALRAKKPVYVEKPMALNYRECLEMIAASKKNKVPLYVAYYRRSLPSFLKVKELLDSAILGKVISIRAAFFKHVDKNLFKNNQLPWRFNPQISGGGLLFDLVSHQLDLLDFLFDPIVEISAICANRSGLYQVEDVAGASLIFKSGVFCSAFWCFALPQVYNTDIIEIYGTRGKITFSTFNFTPVKLESQTLSKTFSYPKPVHIQYNMLNKIVNQLTGEEKISSNADSAARTSLILDKITASFFQAE